jgi:hypothetical protein
MEGLNSELSATATLLPALAQMHTVFVCRDSWLHVWCRRTRLNVVVMVTLALLTASLMHAWEYNSAAFVFVCAQSVTVYGDQSPLLLALSGICRGGWMYGRLPSGLAPGMQPCCCRAVFGAAHVVGLYVLFNNSVLELDDVVLFTPLSA